MSANVASLETVTESSKLAKNIVPRLNKLLRLPLLSLQPSPMEPQNQIGHVVKTEKLTATSLTVVRVKLMRGIVPPTVGTFPVKLPPPT